MVKRFEVYLINLDERVTDDPRNTRPGVVISPDEMNKFVEHVIIAPMASTNAKFPTRIPVEFLNAERFIILDQIRSVDKERLVKKIGELNKKTAKAVLDLLHELFAE
ncbi:MAG: type II toxin-antitoxin system PemK/MazF family toxin [Acidobacteria bacterium]|nr:type II toxin-antitoxin system PemK/MazF family toxin [Acidobacteriota bacterium]